MSNKRQNGDKLQVLSIARIFRRVNDEKYNILKEGGNNET